MQQTIIYDFLGTSFDPIFQQLQQLEKDQQVTFGEATIRLNRAGIYEVSTSAAHEGFSVIDRCYDYICSLFGSDEFNSG
ncbi:hypothetical protein [Lentibacillus sp. Marseille-P4043]|uniref:hypothetical protein n=1 Tax=Lentibacillus sp. Marseille-P4043 TaxID=2040293 RepID=UPI000D0B8382|nr:hypothetical protein [Lentibacillus sp. Marseille-P4043]